METNSVFVIVMVLIVPILVELMEKSMRNNQIREIRGPLRRHLAPTEEEDAPLVCGWEGRGPTVCSVPEPLDNFTGVTSLVSRG